VESVLGQAVCDPDIQTGNCTCGNHWIDNTDLCAPGPKGFFFRRDSDIYLTWQDPADVKSSRWPTCQTGGPGQCPIYKVRVNDSAALDSNGAGVINHLNGLLADSWSSQVMVDGSTQTRYTGFNVRGQMVEFQLMQYPTRADVDVNSADFKAYITRSFECGFNGESVLMVNRMEQVIANRSLAVACDSYFANREGDPLCPPGGCPKCNEPFYSVSDLNNKNGSFCFNPTQGQICGGIKNASSHINLFDPVGYGCQCPSDGRSYE
jgi:hypothetical protein